MHPWCHVRCMVLVYKYKVSPDPPTHLTLHCAFSEEPEYCGESDKLADLNPKAGNVYLKTRGATCQAGDNMTVGASWAVCQSCCFT